MLALGKMEVGAYAWDRDFLANSARYMMAELSSIVSIQFAIVVQSIEAVLQCTCNRFYQVQVGARA